MSVRVLRSLPPEQEARDVANANYEVLKEEVLHSVAGKLRAEGITTVNRADLEDAYQQGWYGVCQHIIQGRPVTSLAGLLYRMVHRRALDIYRQKHERRRADVDLEQHAVDIDLAEQLDDQLKLNRLLRRLKDRLNDNERQAVTLCVLHGYKRPEAADKLGIDRVVFERIMDGATKKMSGIVASIEARGCGGEEWSRALRTYALGDLPEDEREYKRIRDHVEGEDPCVSCRRYVRGLQGLAAVFPPLLPAGLLGGHEAGILPHLQRLFAPGHGAATMGATTAQTTATVAGTAAVGSTAASGGGLGSVLSGGAVKAAVVVAGIAAAGTISVHATFSHHLSSRAPDPAQLTASPITHSSTPAEDEASAAATHLTGSDQSADETTSRSSQAAPVQRSSQAAAEFGFEGSHSSAPQPSAPQPSAPHPIASAATASAPRPTREESSARFGFEDAGTASAPRPSREESSAEFGFEDAGKSK